MERQPNILGDKRGRAHVGTSCSKGVWGNKTHSIVMIETLEHPHLTPHALLIPLDFILRNRFQCDLTRGVPRHRLGGGAFRGRERERSSGERVVCGGGGRRRWASWVALSKGPLFWWYVSCRALPYAMVMMQGL